MLIWNSLLKDIMTFDMLYAAAEKCTRKSCENNRTNPFYYGFVVGVHFTSSELGSTWKHDMNLLIVSPRTWYHDLYPSFAFLLHLEFPVSSLIFPPSLCCHRLECKTATFLAVWKVPVPLPKSQTEGAFVLLINQDGRSFPVTAQLHTSAIDTPA